MGFEKGGFTMKARKILIVAVLFTICALLGSGSQIWAGGGGIEPPPPGATLHGPEIWGTVVLYCSGAQNFAVVRVKRVVDCNVQTQAVAEPNWSLGCSDDQTAPLGQSLPVGTKFFALPGTPYITKVKNWKKDGNAYSFDAQFNFWEP
jgi:hypothetical protein